MCLLSACSCRYREGKGDGQQVLIGAGIEQNQCVDKCTVRRESSPLINGLAWDESTKTCYCLNKMKRINGHPRYKSCFLKGKYILQFSKQKKLPPPIAPPADWLLTLKSYHAPPPISPKLLKIIRSFQ